MMTDPEKKAKGKIGRTILGTREELDSQAANDTTGESRLTKRTPHPNPSKWG